MEGKQLLVRTESRMGDPRQGGVVEKGRSQKVELPDSSGIEAAKANTNCTRLSLLQVRTLAKMCLYEQEFL